MLTEELKEYLFEISKKTEEDDLLEEEVVEMNDALMVMEKLLEKVKKCNILNKPKRSKKLELNSLAENVEAPQLNSSKQIETRMIPLPIDP